MLDRSEIAEHIANLFRFRCILFAVLLAGFGCQSDAKPPDVLLLIVDTLRADHLPLYGYPRNTSPALDTLAASSIVFRNVVATASWTLPSAASVLTGTYPSTHGLRTQKGLTSVTTLRSEIGTLAEAFEAAGYRTVAVVTNPWVNSAAHGLRRGFTDFRDADKFSSAQVNEVARTVLEEKSQQPIFLYLHYMDVHGPYNQGGRGPVEDIGPARSADWRPLRPKENKSIPGYLRIPGVRHLGGYLDAYDRGIRAWDDDFGKLIDWLRRTGRLDRTVISVLADHGEEFLDHGGWDHGTSLHEELIAVPWILKVPGISGSSVRDEVVSLVDVAPSLLGAAQVPIPEMMTGRDLRSALPNSTPVSVFSEHGVERNENGGFDSHQVAVRRGHTKLIVGPKGKTCFDLSLDRRERLPKVASPYCDAQLRDLERWQRETARTIATMSAPQTREVSPDERERLRELGYGD